MRILLAFTFLFLPLSVFAQSIVINEIAWMGTPVAGVEEKQWWRYEWLELYNNADTVEMLDGWTVELYRDDLDFTVLLKGMIVPHGYYIAGASDKIPGVDVNFSNLGGKFLNTGQKVILSTASGDVVDEVDATTGWPAGDNKTKQTMERTSNSVGVSDTPTWQTSALAGGTPKSPNSAGIAKEPADTQVKLSLTKDEVKLALGKDEQEQTEKDLAGRSDSLGIESSGRTSDESSDSKRSSSLQSFQGRVPIINPITLLAGLLALGFSGALLAAKRLLALRQSSGQASRQARLPAPTRSRGEPARQERRRS